MHPRRQADGFTVTELLAVVALIGVVAAVLCPRVIGGRTEAKRSRQLAGLASLQAAIESHAAVTGAYPPSLAALVPPPGLPPDELRPLSSLPDPMDDQYAYDPASGSVWIVRSNSGVASAAPPGQASVASRNVPSNARAVTRYALAATMVLAPVVAIWVGCMIYISRLARATAWQELKGRLLELVGEGRINSRVGLRTLIAASRKVPRSLAGLAAARMEKDILHDIVNGEVQELEEGAFLSAFVPEGKSKARLYARTITLWTAAFGLLGAIVQLLANLLE